MAAAVGSATVVGSEVAAVSREAAEGSVAAVAGRGQRGSEGRKGSVAVGGQGNTMPSDFFDPRGQPILQVTPEQSAVPVC